MDLRLFLSHGSHAKILYGSTYAGAGMTLNMRQDENRNTAKLRNLVFKLTFHNLMLLVPNYYWTAHGTLCENV